MAAQFARAPHRGRPAVPANAPNAALLIDFDNVTMGIRSDLSKELKNLLNSDIIKGKVAVQRAYADWRRYPQYIVPLSEASVDLIFAPAYGSSKKNATDIRLAIDALELVFTRPEIGTFILLSGDSDFSSLVLKLKEYGKYVVGVGMRESRSDLLVQNCDEYYSYSSLTGLTKAGDETPPPSEDPWVLVARAVERMVKNKDVMRSDRLKQVMLELDPNFDEKDLGYSKFNRFLSEAANRNRIELRRMDNGQYEVAPAQGGGKSDAKKSRSDSRKSRSDSRRSSQRSRGSSSSSRSAPEAKKSDAKKPEAKKAEAKKPEPKQDRGTEKPSLEAAYELLRRAVSDLTNDGEEPARDSDVKRRILELEAGWSEEDLGFGKFSHFLRQAHNEEAVDLRKSKSGYYEVLLPGQSDEPDVPPRRRSSGSRRSSGRRTEEAKGRTQDRAEATAETKEAKPEETAEAKEQQKDTGAEKEPAASSGASTAAARAEARALRFRRGRGRQSGPSGPPPLLEGQTVALDEDRNGKKDDDAKKTKASESRATSKKSTAKKSTKSTSKSTSKKSAAKKSTSSEPAGKDFATELGLPTSSGSVTRYMVNSYKGVGKKTASTLIEAFGADKVFWALKHEAEKVKEVLGSGRRANALMEAWTSDYERRLQDAENPSSDDGAEAGKKAEASGGSGSKGRRSGKKRSGRRGRSRKKAPAGGS